MTKQNKKQFFNVFAVFVLALAMTLQALFVPNVSAAQITARKLTLQAGSGGNGGSKISGVVNHLFDFTLPTSGSVGSIKFEYCTTAADSLVSPTCITPTGLTTTGGSVVLGNEFGATGFSLNKTTNGAPYLTRTAAAITGPLTVSYRLDNIVNPSTEGTFFVRIKTYTSTDTTGSSTDAGTVNASTAEQIILTGTMPESLVFCAGADIAKTAGVPDCSTATSGAISFNQLFSPTDTASAVSKMAASTNAGSGYAITINGPTLTSGGNTIAGIATPSASNKGVAQFGLNLRANTVAAAPGFPGTGATASADIDLASNVGASLRGNPTADYNTADTFKFVTGNVVANSAYDGTTNTTLGPSDAQIYTVSYIANVPGSQPAGTYTSTLTYICTPTF
ncbi:hypothetical protein H7142_00990 [Candidatus Saccharibacteria bacterium]|nr:hypothetical protein [Candidatus Saccharibacteria bacterium]